MQTQTRKHLGISLFVLATLVAVLATYFTGAFQSGVKPAHAVASNFSATHNAGGAIALTWTSSFEIVTWHLLRTLGTEYVAANAVLIGFGNDDRYGFIDVTAHPGFTYHYRLSIAEDEVGVTFAELTFTLPARDTTTTPAVSGIEIGSLTSNSFSGKVHLIHAGLDRTRITYVRYGSPLHDVADWETLQLVHPQGYSPLFNITPLAPDREYGMHVSLQSTYSPGISVRFKTLRGPHVSHMFLSALDHDEVEFVAGITLNGGDRPTVYYRRAISVADDTWGSTLSYGPTSGFYLFGVDGLTPSTLYTYAFSASNSFADSDTVLLSFTTSPRPAPTPTPTPTRGSR